jgi:hypothetical protein
MISCQTWKLFSKPQNPSDPPEVCWAGASRLKYEGTWVTIIPVTTFNKTLAVDGVCRSCGPWWGGPSQPLDEGCPFRWNTPSCGRPLNMAWSTFNAFH